MKTIFSIMPVLLVIYLLTSCGGYTDDSIEGVTVTYEESGEAFRNPVKGYKRVRYINDPDFTSGEYVSTVSHIIRYTDLELTSGDTVQKIIDWSDNNWSALAGSNIKVIPRVVLVNNRGEEYWPDGMGAGSLAEKWTGEIFKQRITAFIAKLGVAWDNDPRVAAIEMGLWGYWGEHHIYPDSINGSDRIPPDIQKVMGDAFAKAFINKKVMVRYPAEFTSYNFGYYWDSFALPQDNSGDLIIQRNTWRTVMNGGEVAYDWGDLSNIGANENETLSSVSHTNNIIEWVQRTHTSHLGWISNYNQNNTDPVFKNNAARLQKAFGYRFTVQSATFPKEVNKGGALAVEFTVKNTGSAPFYYSWPVELSLLNSSKTPVWKGVFDTDITTWLPEGDIYAVRGHFSLPAGIAEGTYTLALAILDPAGNMPSIRFANKNYYRGGRMPLGTIGIGRPANSDNLGSFDSLYSDFSLFYN